MNLRTRPKLKVKPLKTACVILTALAGSGIIACGQSTDQLAKENQDLKRRLDALEQVLKKEGIDVGDANAPAKSPIKAFSQMTIAGFAQASYFYDVYRPQDNHPTGYLWNTALNQFTLNKVKLTIASPVVDPTKWDAAYRVSLMYGQDATFLNSSSSSLVGFGPIREAYVQLNIPIGTGLNVTAGELISLLNYESGDGGAVNPNFSQGYQWWYTGNGPSGGVQLAYNFNDKVGVKARLQNGLYSGELSSGPKTFMGGLYINPDDKTSLSFLGFAGHQNFNPFWYLDGGSFIGSRQITKCHNVSFATEADFFHYSGFDSAAAGLAGGAHSGNFWSVGAWLTGELCPKTTLALRGEFLDDSSGFGTFVNSPNPASLQFASAVGFPATMYTSGQGQRLSDVTLTLNYFPVPQLKIQPEVRWNHTTLDGGFNGKSDQVIVGIGASYLF